MKLLEYSGLLKHVKAEVDLKHELGAICVRGLKLRGPGLMFENSKGYPGMRFLSNILSTTEQLAVAFGKDVDEQKIYETIQAGKANPVPLQLVEGGPCQEEVHLGEDVDIN